jgi:hypothetical protein
MDGFTAPTITGWVTPAAPGGRRHERPAPPVAARFPVSGPGLGVCLRRVLVRPHLGGRLMSRRPRYLGRIPSPGDGRQATIPLTPAMGQPTVPAGKEDDPAATQDDPDREEP